LALFVPAAPHLLRIVSAGPSAIPFHKLEVVIFTIKHGLFCRVSGLAIIDQRYEQYAAGY
jgi:hypothetical protein